MGSIELIAAVTALADRQKGVVSGAQLLALGVGIARRKSWCRLGWLRRMHVGVYALGHHALQPEGFWRAGVLAYGDWVALADASAFQALGVLPWTPGPVHLTSKRHLKGQRGLEVHVTRRLPREDVVRRHRLPVTSLARTLLDYAERAEYAEVRRVADIPARLDLDALAACLERNPGRRGGVAIRRLLAREEAHTKSEFERRWLRVMLPLGVPWPDERNVRIAGHMVDMHHVTERVGLELDGRAQHQRAAQMREDRRRDGDVQTAGKRLFRVVWEDLDAEFAPDTARRFLKLLAS